MARPLVTVADSVFPDLVPAEQVLAQLGAEVRLLEQPTPEAITAAGQESDGLMVTYAQINGDMIRQMKQCRVIARFGVGVDNVDIPAATEAGIVVTYVPDYCMDEVSDHTMALLLALIRKIPLANKSVQEGRWEMPVVVPIHRIRGTTLGLLGFGKVPRLVAPKAQAFGMDVITYDPYVDDEACRALGVERVDLDTLLGRADYISVHSPLTPETRHILNAEALARVKPGVYIVNTARGPLIDRDALAAALDRGQVAGAGLDVLEHEPPPHDSPLLGRDNVILQPHTAFYSEESLVELQTKAAQDVFRVLTGQRPRNPVNPEVVPAVRRSVLRSASAQQSARPGGQ